MINRIASSYINPLHFVEVDPVILIPQYRSKHMDDYWLEERLNQWQSLPGDRWYQPWQQNDVIGLQFQNNMGQVQIDIINCQKQVLDSFLMDQKRQDTYEPDYYIYETFMALSGISEGYAWVIARIGASPVRKTLISEPLLILNEQPGTLLCEYSNYQFYENIVFETGFNAAIRFKGLLRKKPTASKDTVYEDQDLDMLMIHSKPYRVWELLIGAAEDSGVPDWHEDQLGRILGCSSLKIDGRYYTKNEGAKLEEQDERFNGTLYTYKIELREKLNRHSNYWQDEGNLNEDLVIVLNSTSKGFADTSDNASSSVVTFFDVE